MARRRRPGRTLLGFFVGLALAYGLVALTGTWTPTLGLDLQGGTRITLIAEGDPSEDNLVEASEIIDQRVNGSGVSEAEVTTQGNQFVVVEADGTVSVYRNWFQDYSRETITAELEAGGFAVQGVWNDLIGTAFAEGGEWIGVVVQKI